MRVKKIIVSIAFIFSVMTAQANSDNTIFKAGHSSLAKWKLGDVPYPKENKPNKDRVTLGKMLFFDPRLSRDGNMSCATCHSPLFGWSDGLPTAKGFKSQVLDRASPTVINTAYNSIQMWDGRKKTLEDQAMGPMESNAEMNMDIPALIKWLINDPTYSKAFAKAYPKEKVGEVTISKALASFERTIISKNSPFDAWINGDKKALSKQQINGFKIFIDTEKGNCAGCHSAPNFVDDGFHNIGLASYGKENPDMGRYAERPLNILKGAFKTPTLRDIAYTAPYFHDGSAKTLMDVVELYTQGGKVKKNISPGIKPLSLTEQDKLDLVAFMESLSSPQQAFTLPTLP